MGFIIIRTDTTFVTKVVFFFNKKLCLFLIVNSLYYFNMIKHYFLILLTVLIYNLSVKSQDFLTSNPMSVSGSGITQNNIEKLIQNHEKIFSASEITSLKEKVLKYNQNIDANIDKLLSERQGLIDIRQKIVQNQSATKLVAQIDEAKRNYTEIQEDIKKNLQDISYKALYVYVEKEVNPFSDPDDLIDKATATIAPYAILEGRGTFLTSATELYQNEGFDDKLYRYIKEELSGQVRVEEKYNHNIIPNKKIFWYVCKVDIDPLKSSVEMHKAEMNKETDNILVLRGLKEKDISTKLSAFGLDDAFVKEIQMIVNQNKQQIINENRSIKMRENNIIRNGQAKLNDLTYKIAELTQRLDRSHAAIKKLIEINTSVSYDKNNVARSIKLANTELKQRINANIQEELNWHERKIKAEWERNVATSGDPIVALARNVMEIKQQFETNYGKIEQYVEIKELTNDEFSIEQGANKVYTQRVNQLWVFPMTTSEGWKLSVVSNFKISSETEHQPAEKAHATVAKVNENKTKKSGSFHEQLSKQTAKVKNTISIAGDYLVDSRDGKKYKTVKIGNQVWMAENLAYLPDVSPGSKGSSSKPYYYVYDYSGFDVKIAANHINAKKYGVLYNYQAAVTACPDGWMLPGEADWEQLADYIVNKKGYKNYNNTWVSAGAELMATNAWDGNAQVKNSYGFSAMPGGLKMDGRFYHLGKTGYWWTATKVGSTRARYIKIYYKDGNMYKETNAITNGYNIRCIKNNN